jgi:hypothetical protein
VRVDLLEASEESFDRMNTKRESYLAFFEVGEST